MDRLRSALEIPDCYVCVQGTVATGMEAPMIMLRRFAYPNRWSNLVPLFRRHESKLTESFR